MSVEIQWVVCGVILAAALCLLAWRMGWLPKRGGKGQEPSCSTGCPKCDVVEQMSKRLEQLQ